MGKRASVRAVSLAALTLSSSWACSRSNNLLLGEVQAEVGSHHVRVTDCYRTSVDPPRETRGGGVVSYRFTPCRDADVLVLKNLVVNKMLNVNDDELTVNTVYYGRISPNDSILVDHGVVSVNGHEARPYVY